MLEQSILQNYLDILREELVPATGCTEPIAIAYCAATLRELLGALPERVDAAVSGNILKNVKSVVVPNTGGRKGIGPAIAVGLVAGDAARDLQVISAVTEKQLAELDAYLQRVGITVSCSHSPCQLDIDLRGSCGSHTARVRITNHHTNIVCLERDGEVLRELPVVDSAEEHRADKSLLNVADILRFAAEVPLEDLLPLLPRFTGEIQQVPPMYSAVKIGGQKLYQIARRGGEIQRPARPVTVYELELLDQTGPGDYTLRIRCSKGTYVRTLCHDIGQALGCGGCMSSLRRTVAAGFTLEEAVTLDRVQEEGEALLAPLDSLFRQHPAYRIRHPRVDALCRNGNPFTVRQELPEGVYRVYGQSGEFLCLSCLEGGVMTSLKNFFGA